MNTPIYDQLLTEVGHRPACSVCGDYALQVSQWVDVWLDFIADAYDVLGLGSSVFRDLLRGLKPEFTEFILGGPR